MIEYKILDTIVLGFLTHNDSCDVILNSEDGYLKFDGNNIILVDIQGFEHVSHTCNQAIDIWVNQKKIEKRD